MKKFLFTVFASVIFAAFMFNTTMAEDIVRIHIRANSNSESDQAVKLKVRDEINEYLTPILEKPETKEEALNVLKNELDTLKDMAEKVSGQECKVSIKEEYFPEKTYNNKVYPEGEYTALIIEIGSGEGRNWWCVAFPNMCYTSSEKQVEYKFFFIEILERLGVL